MLKRNYLEIKKIIFSKTGKDSVTVFFGNIFSALLFFISTVILARGLSVEDFGNISILIAIITLIAQLTNFGIDVGFIKYTSFYLVEGKKAHVSAILKAVLKIKIIISIALLILGVIFSKQISIYLSGSEELSLFVTLCFIGGIGNMITNYFSVMLQSYQFFSKYAISKIIPKFLEISAILVLFLFSINVLSPYIFSIVIIPYIAAFINYFIIPKEEFKISIDKELNSRVTKRILSFSIWVAISSLCVMLTTRIDMFMLQNMISPEQTAYYSSAQKLAYFFPILSGVLTTVLLPRVSAIKTRREIYSYIKKATSIVFLMIIPMIVLLLISRHLILFLFGPNYEPSIILFQILLLSSIINIAVNPVSILFYTLNKHYLLTILNVLQLVVVIASNLYFIPKYQALGAALTTGVARSISILFIPISLFIILKYTNIFNKEKYGH